MMFLHTSRHSPLSTLAVAGLLTAASAPAQIPQGDIAIELETLAAGLRAPIYATDAGDGSGRLFVVDQSGPILIIQNGVVLPTPFLDLTSEIPALNPGFDERGVLGIAFHPDYEDNGRFFVRHSRARQGTAGEPCFGTSRGCHEEVLAEFSVSADPNVANPIGAILFRVDKPQFNHNAGQVTFGPDGYLYFSFGDGGGAHDGLADNPPSHGPFGNAQNIDAALGKLHRIDVDSSPQAPLAYAIPADNPFVNQPGLDEIFAYGLRNPYRFCFDDRPGGDNRLILADVGQNLFEEINIVERGGNYGWVIREGLHCFNPFAPTVPPASCSATGMMGEPLLDPIAEYAHPNTGFNPVGGISITGGFVYRGSQFPALFGKYVFGDFAQAFNSPSGRLYYLDEPAPGSFAIREFQLGRINRPYGLFLKGFGQGENGEIYVCGSTALAPTGNTGVIQRIVALPQPGLDIRPGACPNPFNPKSHGIISAGLLGTNDFDLADIDTDTIGMTRAGSLRVLVADLDGPQDGTDSTATGHALMTLDLDTNELTMDLEFEGLLGTQTVQHVHGPAAPGTNAPPIFDLPGPGSFEGFSITLSELQKQIILSGLAYINVHSTRNPGGEIRGQILPATVPPRRIRSDDVGTPFPGSTCGCHNFGADGIDDLSLQFRTDDLVDQLLLKGLPRGADVELAIIGKLNDGSPFEARDCVRIVGNQGRFAAPQLPLRAEK